MSGWKNFDTDKLDYAKYPCNFNTQHLPPLIAPTENPFTAAANTAIIVKIEKRDLFMLDVIDEVPR